MLVCCGVKVRSGFPVTGGEGAHWAAIPVSTRSKGYDRTMENIIYAELNRISENKFDQAYDNCTPAEQAEAQNVMNSVEGFPGISNPGLSL